MELFISQNHRMGMAGKDHSEGPTSVLKQAHPGAQGADLHSYGFEYLW